MRRFHACWDSGVDACAVLAEAFPTSSPIPLRQKAWAAIVGGIGGHVRPYLLHGDTFSEKRSAIQALFPNHKKRNIRHDEAERSFRFNTGSGISVCLSSPKTNNLKLVVEFGRDSCSAALDLTSRLGDLLTRIVALANAFHAGT